MKKLVAALLSVISVITIAVPAFAEEIPDEAAVPTDSITEEAIVETSTDCSPTPATSIPEEEAIPVPEESFAVAGEEASYAGSAYDMDEPVAEPSGEDPAQEDTGEESLIGDVYVAVMYLCVSGPHAPYLFGHTWICIKNTSGKDITVGSETLRDGEMISVGLHSDGGMHYDDELGTFNGKSVSALEYKLTQDDLDAAESEIIDSRWHWYEYFAHNCTNFATSVWNKVTGQHLFAFCFPFVVQIQMAIRGLEKVVMSNR